MAPREHILVVEDEEHLATGIKYNLDAEGYRVTAVGDGPSALRVVEENPGDVQHKARIRLLQLLAILAPDGPYAGGILNRQGPNLGIDCCRGSMWVVEIHKLIHRLVSQDGVEGDVLPCPVAEHGPPQHAFPLKADTSQDPLGRYIVGIGKCRDAFCRIAGEEIVDQELHRLLGIALSTRLDYWYTKADLGMGQIGIRNL